MTIKELNILKKSHLKNIKKFEKKSGIYRFYFHTKDGEISYVGISKNINSRIRNHINEIYHYYKILNTIEIDKTKETISGKCRMLRLFHLFKKGCGISAKDALYIKVCIMSIIYKINPLKELNVEIIKEIKDLNPLDPKILLLEMDCIEKYNCYFSGLNGPHAKTFQLFRFYSSLQCKAGNYCFRSYGCKECLGYFEVNFRNILEDTISVLTSGLPSCICEKNLCNECKPLLKQVKQMQHVKDVQDEINQKIKEKLKSVNTLPWIYFNFGDKRWHEFKEKTLIPYFDKYLKKWDNILSEEER